MNCKQADQHITMCVDGELDPETEQALTLHMEDCPPCRHTFEAEQGIKTLVAGKAPRVQAPAHLAQRIRESLPAAAPSMTWKERLTNIVDTYPRQAVAAIAALLIITAVSVVGDTPHPQTPPFMVAELVGHHINCPVDVQSDNPEVLDAWFNQRVNLDVETPRLNRDGLQLVGGHLCQTMHHETVYIIYNRAGSDTQTSRISVVCIADNPQLDLDRLRRVRFHDIQFYTAEYQGENLVLWHDGNKLYSCIGQMPQHDLLAMASSIRS